MDDTWLVKRIAASLLPVIPLIILFYGLSADILVALFLSGLTQFFITLACVMVIIDAPVPIHAIPRIYQVELIAPGDTPAQLRRDKIELTASEWGQLRKIARMVADGETFNARSVENYAWWRKRMMRYGWLRWRNPANHKDGVEFTKAGEAWLRHLAEGKMEVM